MSDVKLYAIDLDANSDYTPFRPATTAEIMEAYRDICKSEGKQMYQINGEEVWLTPYAGQALNLSIRHWEAKQ